MQIFLQILSIIGIVLLCIIGLILFLAGLVLFVPIRYRVKIKKETEVIAQIHFTWLLHFLHVNYHYPMPGEIVLKILGIPVWKSRFQEKNTGAEAVTAESEIPENKETENKAAENNTEARKTEETEKQRTAENPKEKPEKSAGAEIETKSGALQKIWFKIKRICVKIKKIFKDFEYYKDLLQKKENRLLFERCKRRASKLLKHLKPDKLQAEVYFGTGEPDTTGYLMGFYGMLLPLLGKDICVTPDFEQRVLEGRVYGKGRITLFYVLYQGARIYFDEGLHRLIENI